MPALIALALLLAGTAAAKAHGGDPHGAGFAWSFDPLVVALLATSAGLYATGTLRLWRRAGAGRGISPARAASYAAGWLVLAGALLSPLHALGEHVFTAHMVEHELVMAVAAPLLALSRPLGAFAWALPRRFARRLRLGRLAGMGSATVLHGLALWLWHIPAAFDAAVRSDALHRLQHGSFLVTGLLFWHALVAARAPGRAVWHLFATMIHMSILGALIALAPDVLYPLQTSGAAAVGLTPLEDQQLAGLVMWVPAGTVYAGAALLFAGLWISRTGETAYAPAPR
jgi:cytochrome c oxidase assembly factor CtaG